MHSWSVLRIYLARHIPFDNFSHSCCHLQISPLINTQLLLSLVQIQIPICASNKLMKCPKQAISYHNSSPCGFESQMKNVMSKRTKENILLKAKILFQRTINVTWILLLCYGTRKVPRLGLLWSFWREKISGHISSKISLK